MPEDPFADIGDLLESGDNRQAVRAYGRAKAAQRGIDPDFADRLWTRESGYNRNALNKQTGAAGIGQMIPGTAKRFGLTDPHDAKQSIDKSLDYLEGLHKKFGGDTRRMAAGYFAGEGQSDRALANPAGNPKTQAYANAVGGPPAGGRAKPRPTQKAVDPLSDISDLLEGGDAPAKTFAPPKSSTIRRDARGNPQTWDGYPAIKNPDGSLTTERSITITDPQVNGGRPTNIPSVWGGKQLSQDEAIAQAVRSKHPFDAFGSIDEAVKAAEERTAQKGRELDTPTVRSRPTASTPHLKLAMSHLTDDSGQPIGPASALIAQKLTEETGTRKQEAKAQIRRPQANSLSTFQADPDAEHQFELAKTAGDEAGIAQHAATLKAKGYEVGADNDGNPYQKRPAGAPAATRLDRSAGGRRKIVAAPTQPAQTPANVRSGVRPLAEPGYFDQPHAPVSGIPWVDVPLTKIAQAVIGGGGKLVQAAGQMVDDPASIADLLTVEQIGKPLRKLAAKVSGQLEQPGLSDILRGHRLSTTEKAVAPTNPVYRAGVNLEEAANVGAENEGAPTLNPAKSDFWKQLPRRAGSMVLPVASGPAAPLVMAMQTRADQYKDALNHEASQQQASDAATQGTMLGGAVGLIPGGAAARAPMGIAKTLAREGALGFGMGAAQKGGENVIANTGAGYDPQRPTMEGVGHAGLEGALTGPMMALPHAVGAGRSRPRPNAEPRVEPARPDWLPQGPASGEGLPLGAQYPAEGLQRGSIINKIERRQPLSNQERASLTAQTDAKTTETIQRKVAEGKPLTKAETASLPTEPEAPGTLQAQIDAVKAGRGDRKAVLVTPGEAVPARHGLSVTDTAVGRFLYDANQVSARTIRRRVGNGTYHELLGIVEPKSAKTTEAVVARSPEGVEQQAAMVSPEKAPEQAQKLAEQFPEATVTSEPPEKVIAERAAGNQTPTEVGARPAEPQSPVTPEQRQEANAAHRVEIDALMKRVEDGQGTPADKAAYRELMTHELSGVPNRRAYNRSNAADEASGATPHHAALDVVGLKATNDTIGHHKGDELLTKVANIIAEESPTGGYHISGDEFALKGASPEELTARIGNIRERLKGVTVEYVAPDGSTGRLEGVKIHDGIGKDEKSANLALNDSKESAPKDNKGRIVSGLAEKPATGEQDNQSVSPTKEVAPEPTATKEPMTHEQEALLGRFNRTDRVTFSREDAQYLIDNNVTREQRSAIAMQLAGKGIDYKNAQTLNSAIMDVLRGRSVADAVARQDQAAEQALAPQSKPEVAPEPAKPVESGRTKLDLLLDKVQPGQREITFDVRDYTEEQKQRVIDTAEARGLHASSDGRSILVRDLSSPVKSTAEPLPRTESSGKIAPDVGRTETTGTPAAAGTTGHSRASETVTERSLSAATGAATRNVTRSVLERANAEIPGERARYEAKGAKTPEQQALQVGAHLKTLELSDAGSKFPKAHHKRFGDIQLVAKTPDGAKILFAQADADGQGVTYHMAQNPEHELLTNSHLTAKPEDIAKLPTVSWNELGTLGDAHPPTAVIEALGKKLNLPGKGERAPSKEWHRLSDIPDDVAIEHFPEVFRNRVRQDVSEPQWADMAIQQMDSKPKSNEPKLITDWRKDVREGGLGANRVDLIAKGMTVAAYDTYRDVKNFGAWSKKMVADWGQSIKPKLQSIWEAATNGSRKAQARVADWLKTFVRGDSQAGFITVGMATGGRSKPKPNATPAKPEGGKLWQNVVDVANAPRSLMSSFDVSAPLRQGAIFSLTEPVASFKAGRDMFKALVSNKANYEALNKKIEAHPDYQRAVDAGVEFTKTPDAGTPLSAREESFMSGLVGKIPHVKYAEQAYVTFLNSQRLHVYSKFAKELAGRSAKPEAFKDIARFVNYATGRGDLGRFQESIGPALNALFFSPRYAASRIQTPAFVLDPRVAGPARRIALRKLAQFSGVVGSALALAKLGGAEVGTNPDDADFLKIKVGDTRYDTLAGFQQYMVLASRLTTGFTNEAKGEPNTPQTDPWATMKRFLRGKLAPVPSAIVDWGEKKNIVGEPFSLSSEAADRLLPMVVNDARKAWEAEGLLGAVKTLPGLVGVGVQNYKRAPQDGTDRGRERSSRRR